MNLKTAALSLLLLTMPLRASQPEDTVTLQTKLLMAAGGFIAISVTIAALKEAHYYATTWSMTKQERITAKTGAFLRKKLRAKNAQARAAYEKNRDRICALVCGE